MDTKKRKRNNQITNMKKMNKILDQQIIGGITSSDVKKEKNLRKQLLAFNKIITVVLTLKRKK